MSGPIDKTMQNVTRLKNIVNTGNDVSISVLRGDLATPAAIGNKQFKLAENLAALKADGCNRLLSFGGAWSNHLHALAVKAKEIDLEVVGIVRGDPVESRLLRSARNHGMQVVFVSYTDYRQRNNAGWCETLCARYQCDTWLPEGGSNLAAVAGCKKMLEMFAVESADVIALAVGTGATLAGIACGLSAGQTVVGYPVIRDDQVPRNISGWLNDMHCTGGHWRLASPLKPGYAKANTRLIEFILDFYRDTGIALDPVYTGKAMMHIVSEENIASLPAGSHVAFVHTGGLMGAFGYIEAFDKFRDTKPVAQYFATVEELTAPSW